MFWGRNLDAVAAHIPGNIEARSYVGKMAVPPPSWLHDAIYALIDGLKQDGLWPLLGPQYILGLHDEQAGRLNLRSPGFATLVASTPAPVFTAYRGFQGDGSSSSLDTVVSPANMPPLAQDSQSVHAWVSTAGTLANRVIGTAFGTASAVKFQLNPRNASGKITARLGVASDVTSLSSVASRVGFTSAMRASSGEVRLFKDGVLVDALSSTSDGIQGSTATVRLFRAFSSSEWSNDQAFFAGCAAGMTDAQVASYYSRLSTFKTAIDASGGP